MFIKTLIYDHNKSHYIQGETVLNSSIPLYMNENEKLIIKDMLLNYTKDNKINMTDNINIIPYLHLQLIKHANEYKEYNLYSSSSKAFMNIFNILVSCETIKFKRSMKQNKVLFDNLDNEIILI